MKIAKDKLKHIAAGVIFGIVFPLIGSYIFPEHLWANLLISFGIVVQIGFGFELFSMITGRGHAEINDALATTAGGAIGVILYLAGYLIF